MAEGAKKIRVGPRGSGLHSAAEDEFMDIVATSKPPRSRSILGWIKDPSDFVRHSVTQPGQPLHNVRFSQRDLQNYYWYLQCCETYGEEQTRTFMDIYENSVQLNRVSSSCCGCCCIMDHPRLIFMDRRGWLSKLPKRAACCDPICPFPCVHCFGICGEVIIFEHRCCGPADSDSAPGFKVWSNGFCSVAAVYGIAEGGCEGAIDTISRAIDISHRSMR